MRRGRVRSGLAAWVVATACVLGSADSYAGGHRRGDIYETVYAAPAATVLVEPSSYIVASPVRYLAPSSYVVRDYIPTSAVVYERPRPIRDFFQSLRPTAYYRLTPSAYVTTDYVVPSYTTTDYVVPRYTTTTYVVPRRYVETSLTTIDLPIVREAAVLCCDTTPARVEVTGSYEDIREPVRATVIDRPASAVRSNAVTTRPPASIDSSVERTDRQLQIPNRSDGGNPPPPRREIQSTPKSQGEAPDPAPPPGDDPTDAGGTGTQTPPKPNTNAPATGDNAAGQAGTGDASEKADPAAPVDLPPIEPSELQRRDSLKPRVASMAVLEGQVIDAATRAPESGVSVVLSDLDKQQTNRIGTTDALGRFALTMPAGSWKLTATFPNGRTSNYGDFIVEDGRIRDGAGREYTRVTLKR